MEGLETQWTGLGVPFGRDRAIDGDGGGLGPSGDIALRDSGCFVTESRGFGRASGCSRR